jgi:hypothetical protein
VDALVVVYIFHEHAPAVTPSRFKVDVGTTGWTHLHDAWSTQDFVGTSVDGVTIEYGSCRTSSIYLGQIHFQGTSAPDCSHVGIVPDPGAVSGKIEAVDCNDNPMYPTGGQAIVNPTPDCQCTVPVEETTWGEIKALYR